MRLEETPPKQDRQDPEKVEDLRASYEPDRYHLSTFWNETRGDAETRSMRPQEKVEHLTVTNPTVTIRDFYIVHVLSKLMC